MVTVLPKVKSFGEKMGGALGRGLSEGVEQGLDNRKKLQALNAENEQIKKATGIDLSGINDPETRKIAFSEQLKGQMKKQELQEKYAVESEALMRDAPQLFDEEGNFDFDESLGETEVVERGPRLIPDSKIADWALKNPKAADRMQKYNDRISKIKREEDKLQREAEESEVLSKFRRGEELTPEDEAKLSPVSARSLIEKPVYEPTAQRLQAERSSKEAEDIEKQYKTAKDEEMRLNRQEELAEKGNLSTPAMTKLLTTLGIPLGVLGNPDTEEYAKLETDYVRNVNDIFRGQIRVFEVQTYLKTIPSLLNSDEGKKAIIRNRRLLNEGAEIKYKAYKDILKENDGIPPPNLSMEIEDRTRGALSDLADRFREGMEDANDKFSSKVVMYDKDGRKLNIPAYKIPEALEDGLFFQ
jgi:hypothetical protein